MREVQEPQVPAGVQGQGPCAATPDPQAPTRVSAMLWKRGRPSSPPVRGSA